GHGVDSDYLRREPIGLYFHGYRPGLAPCAHNGERAPVEGLASPRLKARGVLRVTAAEAGQCSPSPNCDAHLAVVAPRVDRRAVRVGELDGYIREVFSARRDLRAVDRNSR